MLTKAIERALGALRDQYPRARERRLPLRDYGPVIAAAVAAMRPDETHLVLRDTGGILPNSYKGGEADNLVVELEPATGIWSVRATRGPARHSAHGKGDCLTVEALKPGCKRGRRVL